MSRGQPSPSRIPRSRQVVEEQEGRKEMNSCTCKRQRRGNVYRDGARQRAKVRCVRVTIRNTTSAVSSERDRHDDDTAGARKETWMEESVARRAARCQRRQMDTTPGPQRNDPASSSPSLLPPFDATSRFGGDQTS